MTATTPSEPASPERPPDGERVAKVIARAGVASRREAEALIEAGRVKVNGVKLETPAVIVTPADEIMVDDAPIPKRLRTRAWLFNKPRGLVTTNHDPEGRPTIFDALPGGLPRVVTVGRLDINTEGLLILTNDGGLARVLELPATGWTRKYRVRVHGEIDEAKLAGLRDGVAIDGMLYGPIDVSVDRAGDNSWLTMGLTEGKNREIKVVLGSLGLMVTRLIRISFGPFQLADLPRGEVKEIPTRLLKDQLGPRLAEEASADFDAPLTTVNLAKPARPESRPAARGGSTGARDHDRFERDRKPYRDGGGRSDRPARPSEGGRGSTGYGPRRSSDGPQRASERDGERRPYGPKREYGKSNDAPRGGDGERRPYGPKREYGKSTDAPRGGDGDRRPYGPKREYGKSNDAPRGGDGERRPYGPKRDYAKSNDAPRGGDGERRSYGPKRDYAKSGDAARGGDGERRSYGPKRDYAKSGDAARGGDGERRSYGPKRDYAKSNDAPRGGDGERRPYGPKREYAKSGDAPRGGDGERRSYGPKRDYAKSGDAPRGGDGERRSYGPKRDYAKSGDAPRGGDGERRSYGPKRDYAKSGDAPRGGDGERRSYGPKREYAKSGDAPRDGDGERRSYGPKRDYAKSGDAPRGGDGERRSYGPKRESAKSGDATRSGYQGREGGERRGGPEGGKPWSKSQRDGAGGGRSKSWDKPRQDADAGRSDHRKPRSGEPSGPRRWDKDNGSPASGAERPRPWSRDAAAARGPHPGKPKFDAKPGGRSGGSSYKPRPGGPSGPRRASDGPASAKGEGRSAGPRGSFSAGKSKTGGSSYDKRPRTDSRSSSGGRGKPGSKTR